MTDTDPSGRELDEALAREAGWTILKSCACGKCPTSVQRPDSIYPVPLPEYHAFIDDTLRDHWPELQRRRGWERWSLDLTGRGYQALMLRAGQVAGDIWHEDAEAATALARAFLAAYREGRE